MSVEWDGHSVILLVEDNETIRNAFSILLEEGGYRVVEAASGADAIRISAEVLPDLILMDLGLPDMGGLEATRAIVSREETRAIPVVALTGRALESDQDACFAAGCVGYLTKPIDTEQLLRLLPTYLTQ